MDFAVGNIIVCFAGKPETLFRLLRQKLGRPQPSGLQAIRQVKSAVRASY